MEPDVFLFRDKLHDDGPLEKAVIAGSDQHSLHKFFREYAAQPDVATFIEAHVSRIRDRILTHMPKGGTGVPRDERRTLRVLINTFTKSGGAKIREAIALAHAIGAFDQKNALHIHDVCAGKGPLAAYVFDVRRELGLETTGTCWEVEGKRESGHGLLKQWLAIPDGVVEFHEADLIDADLRKHSAYTATGAKHACGKLTDIILQRVLALNVVEQPNVTGVMTCCYSLLDGNEPFWPEDLPLPLRLAIAKAADPHRDEEHDEYSRDTLAIVCRRFIDSLRAKHYGGEALEVLPYSKDCQRNNAILLRSDPV